MFKNKIIVFSTLFCISSVFLIENVLSESNMKIVLEGNKDANISFLKKDGYIYIDIEDFLKKENIDFVKNENNLVINKDYKEFIFTKNSSTFIVKSDEEEKEYPITLKQIDLVKKFYLPSNNFKTFEESDKLFVPIDVLSNDFIFNKKIIEEESTIILKEKEKLFFNYDYEKSFDKVDIYNLLPNQTALYVNYDESYNNLKVGEKVRPSPTTGFSIIKPKYGFGSDTFNYIPSKGSAVEDGWVAGDISIPFTKNKELIRESFLNDLGLVDGEYIYIDELSVVVRVDFETLDDGVVLIINNNLFLEEKNETYRGKVILSKLLSYYINDIVQFNNIENVLKNNIQYEHQFKETIIDERIILEQYHNNTVIKINFN